MKPVLVSEGVTSLREAARAGLGIAVLGWFVVARVFGHKQLGIAFGLALGSHIILDIIQHEPNIQFAWFLAFLAPRASRALFQDP